MEGWATECLGGICDVLDRLRKPITKKDRVPGPYPYYGATGVLDSVEGYLFDERLVLVGEDGAKWGSGHNSAFAISGKCWVNNHAHVLRPHRDAVMDRWLIYYLNHSDLAPYITGLTVPKLNQGKLREIPVSLPRLPEQKRIVAILDDAFAAIATATANAEKNLANARELFESYLNVAFEKPARESESKPLEELTAPDSPITYGVVKPGAEGDIPFVRGGDISNGQVHIKELRTITRTVSDQYSRTLLRGGEILISLVGQPGQVAVAPKSLAGSNIARQVGMARTKDELNGAYIALYLRSPLGQRELGSYEGGSVQQVINLRDLRRVRIALPCHETQGRICEESVSFERKSDCLMKSCSQKINLLTELKQSILHKAFTGELTADSGKAFSAVEAMA